MTRKTVMVIIRGEDFNRDPTTKEILTEAKRRNYRRPTSKEAHTFKADHPEAAAYPGPKVFFIDPMFLNSIILAFFNFGLMN